MVRGGALLFLPFGLRTAPYIFELFARGPHWILTEKKNVSAL
jgi:hypothetical protein